MLRLNDFTPLSSNDLLFRPGEIYGPYLIKDTPGYVCRIVRVYVETLHVE